jgi:hypothetical protein
VHVRGSRLLDQRFVGCDARIGAFRLHVGNSDREPAIDGKPHRQPAGAMVDERVSFSIFVWT